MTNCATNRPKPDLWPVLPLSWLVLSWMAMAQVPANEPFVKASEYWGRQFSACNGLHYTRHDDGLILEYRGFNVQVFPDPMTESDRLNGIQWKGRTRVVSTSFRMWMPQRGGWQPWQEGMPGVGQRLMSKSNGAWRIENPDARYMTFSPSALPCSEIPSEKSLEQRTSEEKHTTQAACQGLLTSTYETAAQAYLQQGADPNSCRDQNGATALMLRIWNTDVQTRGVITILLDAGADVNSKNMFGCTPLMYAESGRRSASRGITDESQFRNTTRYYEWIIEALRNHGAKQAPLCPAFARAMFGPVGSPAVFGTGEPPSPLFEAVGKGYIHEVKDLLAAGRDVNSKRKSGATPLHVAAAQDDRQMIEMLLQAGGDVNARMINGFTPVMVAVERGCIGGLMGLLLDGPQRPDLTLKDAQGRTALVIAKIKQPSIASTLIERGAKE